MIRQAHASSNAAPPRFVVACAAVLALACVAALGVAGSTAEAAFPGLNGRIACSTAFYGPGGPSAVPAGQERLEIFTINPDGSGEIRLTNTLGGSVSSSSPKYSADGRKIVFQQNNQIWTMNADGSNPTQLTTTDFGTNTPGSWSPDGTKIVFQANREPVPPGSPAGSSTQEIYTMNADGSNLTRLTNNLRADNQPSFSPDGSKIIFRSNRDLNFDIYRMNPDGSEQTNLTFDSPAEEAGPEWSPDGRQIAFHSDRDAFGQGRILERNLEIYRMNADGSAPRRLTFMDFSGGGDPNLDLTGYDRLPAWSPDGTRIVFESGRAPEYRDTGEIGPTGVPYVAQWEVYTINAVDGSDIRRLTNRPRNDEICDWQPIPRQAAPPGPTPTAPVQPAAFTGCPATSSNVIRGSAAGSRINGTARGDRIFGGTGNDVVDALAGDDCVDLGTGDDRGQGGLGDDLLIAGQGKDRVSGSSGNDRMRGNPGNDRLDGGRGNDRVLGDSGNDTLLGGFGNDRLHGVGGKDGISGSGGRDRINGGSANDRISGGSSGDRIAGDAGSDRINGNSGGDRISGNSGNDRITSRDSSRDRVNCGSGRDSVLADRRDVVSRNCERVRRR